MRDTIELCKEAGFPLMVFEGVPYVSPELERLVALVRADERAGCSDAIWKCDGMGLEDRFIAMDVIKARGNT